MTGRRLLLAAAVAVAVGVVCWRWLRFREFALPERIMLEETVADLSGDSQATAVTAAGGANVRPGSLQPGDPLAGGARRTALLARPGARLHFRIAVPPAVGLRFGLGVEGSKQREAGLSGVRFSITVDGREAYARTVNPAANRRDRRWFDERLDLAAEADRVTDIVLAIDAERPEAPLAGIPGWSRLRLTQRTERVRQPASPTTPNVLVLLVDTLRADRLGCYGARPSPSPTLDALAAGGVVFEQAVSQSSWTMPSVASLFSGLHPRQHGAWRKEGSDDEPSGREYLADELLTWAEHAAQSGITTVGVSSNPLVSRATNLAQGFETFVELPWDPRQRNWQPAAEVNATFLRWAAANRAHRFAAYLHYMEPHDPYTPPRALRPPAPAGVRPAVAAGWIRDLANQINWRGAPLLPAAELDYLRALYDGEIRAWDMELGALLEGLEAHGLRSSTIILITADHGEEFQEHGRLTHGSHLYEESIRVPLVVVGPGILPARRPELAQGIDVFPTLVALLGLPARPALPGGDLFAAGGAPRSAISETARGIAGDGGPAQVVSVHAAGWKLIYTPVLHRYELYDLVHDPGERENRYGAAPEGESITRLLVAWEASAPPAPGMADDPALLGHLRALGYVE